MWTEIAASKTLLASFELVFLLLLIGSAFQKADGISNIASYCSPNITLQAPSLSETQRLIITLKRDDANKDCTWWINPINSSTTVNIFSCVYNDSNASRWPYPEVIHFIPDINNASLNQIVNCINNTNVSLKGKPGHAVLISMKPLPATVDNITLGYLFSSMSDEQAVCTGTVFLNASTNKAVLRPPQRLKERPLSLQCVWIIKTNINEVVVLELHIPDNECNNLDFIKLISLYADNDLPLCKNPTTVVRKIGHSFNNFVMEFHSFYLSGTLSDFNISYWSEPLCLLNSVQELPVTEVKQSFTYYKLGDPCHWRFTAPNGLIVKFSFFRFYCASSGLVITIDGNFSANVCDPTTSQNSYWSETSSATIDYTPESYVGESNVVIFQYSAERKGRCQGRPTSLVAKGQVQNLTIPTYTSDVTSKGSNCQWIISASEPGYRVKVIIQYGLSFCSLSRIAFYESEDIQTKYRKTTCTKTASGVLQFISASDMVLAMFIRSLNDSYPLGLSYVQTLESPTTSSSHRCTNVLTYLVFFYSFVYLVYMV